MLDVAEISPTATMTNGENLQAPAPQFVDEIIDFNEQTMRYFDPTLKLGLIHGVMVTPLLGDDWPTGPIE